VRQTLTITGWHPQWNPNGTGNRSHWATLQRRKRVDEDTVWSAARQANWEFLEGRVKLSIVFVYARPVRVDTDNLYARVKGCVDGLRMQYHTGGFPRGAERAIKRKGFFEDDDVTHLDLHVEARTEKGVKATEITLESLEDEALAAGRSDAAEEGGA
jgi:hypothetical protein